MLWLLRFLPRPRLTSMLWIAAALAVAVPLTAWASHAVGYGAGYAAADRAAEIAALRADIALRERDLSVARAAAEVDRQTLALAEAARVAGEQRIADYAAELARRPNGACNLTDDDLRRLLDGPKVDGDPTRPAP